ncbi:MAG: phosphatase PAP2 family protein [Bryobacteraceae bacterium]|jgi:undecaprenyl-diphosphatase
MIRRIAAGDRRVMRRVNQWAAPLWIRQWMVAASRAGDGWLWMVLGLVLLAFGGDRRFDALTTAFISVSAGLVVFFLLKRVAGRERPCSTETHCWAKLLPPDRFSFPSGHTITAFAVAVPFGIYYPVLLPGLLFCALSIASSRIVLGLHYLSDVLAGMLIGCTIGVASISWFGPGL